VQRLEANLQQFRVTSPPDDIAYFGNDGEGDPSNGGNGTDDSGVYPAAVTGFDRSAPEIHGGNAGDQNHRKDQGRRHNNRQDWGISVVRLVAHQGVDALADGEGDDEEQRHQRDADPCAS
jgi:hypothetical protein